MYSICFSPKDISEVPLASSEILLLEVFNTDRENCKTALCAIPPNPSVRRIILFPVLGSPSCCFTCKLRLQYHAGLASGLLNQQSLKRSANQMGVSAKRRPKAQPTTLVLPPQYVDDVINRIDRMFPEMSIQLSRPNGTSAMLLVTLGKVLKVIVVMRSLFIDRTIVKGYNENVYTEDGKLDIWSKSNYQVFQKVTDHATTALLHYQLPQMPDVVVRSFMTWLRSYIKLFQAPCQRCGKFLQDGLPPTWRDFRTLEAFHDTCRQ
ncbi:mediator of RNA polymerase II transcription subunit 27 isoform X2 [Aquila chrysaetos chrysaetos]|uniref:mediator of RNA polymerase II transcription subunit 27 isoform X2 n=1 Tax=Aquila chrysaetos chrysaetos TaxID=223781 RepID=UPI0011767278|nr:mediator of RNA polymerase II transcription subunit 27 isoform X2 [Aquila chrysaetos chrysaetos]